jgi:hypothetical protein
MTVHQRDGRAKSDHDSTACECYFSEGDTKVSQQLKAKFQWKRLTQERKLQGSDATKGTVTEPNCFQFSFGVPA